MERGQTSPKSSGRKDSRFEKPLNTLTNYTISSKLSSQNELYVPKTPPHVIGPEGEFLCIVHRVVRLSHGASLSFEILVGRRFKNQYRTGLHAQLLAIRRIAL